MATKEFEFSGLVNMASDRRECLRQQKAEAVLKLEQHRKAEEAATLRRKQRDRRVLRDMIVEAGSCAGLAGGVLLAMDQSLMAPGLALPVAAVCLICAGIRVDRHFRRDSHGRV